MAELVIPENELTEFDLPRVCVITGATDGVVFKDVKFQWYPRWVAALVLINLLIAAVVAFALTKKVKGKLPFTEAAFAAWRQGVLLMTLSVLFAIGVFIGAIILFANDEGALGGLGLLLALGAPIGVYIAKVKGRTVVCTKIADGVVTLKIPSDAAAAAISEHLHAGAGVVAPT